MPSQLGRKLRHSDITEYRTFPDNFIFTPHRSVPIGDQKLSRNEHSNTYPVLKVAKQATPAATGSRWRLDNIPNLKGIPNGRTLPKLPVVPSQNQGQLPPQVNAKREETFDTDFMMPSRVREVLEDEGLENGVINNAIGESEEKYKHVLRTINGPDFTRKRDKRPRLDHVLPPVITTKRPEPRYNAMGPSSDPSWLDLKRQQPCEFLRKDLWENSLTPAGRDQYLAWNFGRDLRHAIEDVQVELDQKKWRVAQKVEHMYSGDNFTPPRIVLVSSKIPNCHLLTKVYQDDVIPIIYDFDSFTFTEILDSVTKKLELFRKNCKARSVMVLCQGGPGFIYLLRNYVITPQKLLKASYRPVVGFWRTLAGLVSKLNPDEAAIHLCGFNLLDDQQGRKLLPILQSYMYPNLVRVEVPNEEEEYGRAIVSKYFKYARYRAWKSLQKLSAEDESGRKHQDNSKLLKRRLSLRDIS